MNKNLIEYIIAKTGLRQTDIAKELGVSRAQVSKWKSGEFIPFERSKILMKMADIFTDDIEWLELAGSQENASAWCEYIRAMNEISDANTWCVKEEAELKTCFILGDFKNAGIPVPEVAPSTEGFHDEDYDFSPFDSLVHDFFENYGCYVNWASRHLLSLDHVDLYDDVTELESSAISLAISNLEEGFLSNVGADMGAFKLYQEKSNRACRKKMHHFCSKMKQLGVPFEIDYYVYVNESPNWLEDEDMMAMITCNSVIDHLPYGERELIKQTSLVADLLGELHIKIDTLLSNEERIGSQNY
ncbi:MAG: helix-turn-helix transcriptional regulator [Mariprofundaceae bacterium]|nr:helix-turn-helix transcriptional regulator [Mariprofundaceae bacterium]